MKSVTISAILGVFSKRKQTGKLKGWNPILITSGVALFVASVLAYMVFRYQINPDGVSYINIAKRYAAFDLQSAINGYWGPLISWLLVPFIWVGADPVISFYIISTLCSIGIVLIVHWFVQKNEIAIKPLPLYIIELTLLFTLVSLSLSVLTPDILLTFALLLVFMTCISFRNQLTLRNGVLLGASGALLFFAKPAGLLLFIFVLLVNTAHSIMQEKKWSKILIVPFAVFAVLVLPYCTVLSIKYHQLTFSTSSAYNLSYISPAYRRQHIIDLPGIYLPPNEHATSAWDDPGIIPIKHWNPLASGSDFKYYVNQALLNIHNIALYMNNLGIIFLIGITTIFAIALSRKRFKTEVFVASTLIIGLIGLYTFIVIEPRHIWPLIPLSFIGILLLIEKFNGKLATAHQVPLYLSVGVLILSVPFITPTNASDVTPNYLGPESSLAHYVIPGGRIASDNAAAMFTCYNLNIQCTGILPTTADQTTIDYLHKNNINHLLLSNPKPYSTVLDKYYKLLDPSINLYMLK